MIQTAIARIVEKNSLSFDEARGSMEEILRGEATPSQIAGFLMALRMKGETVEEIAGCAAAMRGACAKISASDKVVVDTCGTGGDGRGSFNVSTAAAFVVAGAGFTVAKHGNRSISSQCGSADVLEALGVKIDPPFAVAERCLREIGIAFLFAPAYHTAMKHAMPTRRELGVRTVFNILGPLCNPAHANAQLIGVFSPKYLMPLAKVLTLLGTRETYLVHDAGHDEITLTGKAEAVEIRGGKAKKITLTPKDFGFKAVNKGALAGGSKEVNAEVLRRILSGGKGPGRDVVVANAACAILAAARLRPVARAAGPAAIKTLLDGRRAAEASLDSGAAVKKLESLARLSQSPA